MAVTGLIFIGIFFLLLIGWLVFAADLMYLGPRGVRWVYDRFAKVWNLDERDHRLRKEANDKLLPFLEAAVGRFPDGRYLDVATGTGRVPLLVAGLHGFGGSLVGVDLSRNMLARGQAILRSRGLEDRIVLQEADASQLPFPDASFDVVTCLDSPLPNRRKALAEMARVLKDPGLLITDRRKGRWVVLLPRKVMTRATYQSFLGQIGLQDIQWVDWTGGDELVVAKKQAGHTRGTSKSLNVAVDHQAGTRDGRS